MIHSPFNGRFQESPGVEEIGGVHSNDDHRRVKNDYQAFS
jgi:hypothetical protein